MACNPETNPLDKKGDPPSSIGFSVENVITFVSKKTQASQQYIVVWRCFLKQTVCILMWAVNTRHPYQLVLLPPLMRCFGFWSFPHMMGLLRASSLRHSRVTTPN